MTPSTDPQRDDALLDVMLCDDDWQAANAGLKAEALRTFRFRHGVRRLTHWAAGVSGLAALVALAVHWLASHEVAPRQVTLATAGLPRIALAPRQLSDAELVASFPKGSCFIAEVNGKKQLIFFDPKVERACLARSAEQGE